MLIYIYLFGIKEPKEIQYFMVVLAVRLFMKTIFSVLNIQRLVFNILKILEKP